MRLPLRTLRLFAFLTILSALGASCGQIGPTESEGPPGTPMRAVDATQVATGPCGQESFPLVAGQTRTVGTVTVANDETMILVTLSTSDGWGMQETHVAVAASEEDLTAGNGRLIPGRFPGGLLHDPPVTTVEYTVPREVLEGGETAFVAAHASVVRGDEEEGAWGAGTPIEAAGWASYLTFDLAACGDGVVVEVGSDGGEVPFPGGTLSIPAGALASPVEITVTPVPESDLPPGILPGTAFEFQPEGLVFDTPVSLALEYDDTGLTPDQEAGLAIHLLGAGDVLTALPGTVDTSADIVTGQVSHFSLYVVPVPAGALQLEYPDATNEGGQIVHIVDFVNLTGGTLSGPIIVDLTLTGPVSPASIPVECTVSNPAPGTFVYTCIEDALPAGLWRLEFTHDVAPGSAGSSVQAQASYTYFPSTGGMVSAGTPIAETPIEVSLPLADLGFNISPPDSGSFVGVPFDFVASVNNGYENVVTTAIMTVDVTNAPMSDISLISMVPDYGYSVYAIPGGFRIETPTGYLGMGQNVPFTITVVSPSTGPAILTGSVRDPNTIDPFAENDSATEQIFIE